MDEEKIPSFCNLALVKVLFLSEGLIILINSAKKDAKVMKFVVSLNQSEIFESKLSSDWIIFVLHHLYYIFHNLKNASVSSFILP